MMNATRQKILRIAASLFAELGYDKAGISAIAKAAGINSALIYHYFKNKEALLSEIIDGLVEKANGFLVDIAKNTAAYGPAEMEAQMERYNAFLLQNEGILRIMMMESLKGERAYPPLFRLIDMRVEGLDEREAVRNLNAHGFNVDEDPMKRRVVEFFTGIMPQVAYSLFRAKWCAAYKIAPDSLDALYRKAVEETHGTHHTSVTIPKDTEASPTPVIPPAAP